MHDDYFPTPHVPPPPGCVPIGLPGQYPGQMPFSNLTNRPFNVDGLRNIPDIHAPENLVIGEYQSQ